MILVDQRKCVGCGQCVVACPEEALRVWGTCTVGDECTECLVCIDYCPVKAIEEK
jgi:NAD-dependent dihydropyrimidine dehydrogenase PreA subunit